jgi:hypothetical protein
MSTARKRPSLAVILAGAALVAALAALVVSMAGTATGLPGKHRIDRNDLRKRVVGPIQIKKNAVRGYQVKESTLGQVPSAGFAENGIRAEGRTIPDGTTQTLVNLAQGTIALECDGTPNLRYENDSGATAHVWSDAGSDTPSSLPINGSYAIGLLTTDHVELAIMTDSHLAFLDFYLERTGLTECIAAWKLSEVPR